MRRIESPDIVRLVARVGARRMGDAGLPVALARASAGASDRHRNGSVRRDIGAGAGIALHAYNTARDRDDAGVLGAKRRTRQAREATSFRPLLEHAPGHAWLRVSLDATAEASLRTTRKGDVAIASADGEARLLSYRRHEAGTHCAEAITLDLSRIADAREWSDVRALGVGDACAVQLAGTLSASVTVAWDALLAEVLPAVASVAGNESGAFMLDVRADAKAALKVSIGDRCTVAFARIQASGDRAFRVSVRRHHEAERRLSARAGLAVALSDPGAAAQVLQGALASALGAPARALAAIRQATSLDQLPARVRPVAEGLAERFGIADLRPLPALRARLSELDARMAGRLEEVLHTRLAFAIEAEYRRLAIDATLLELEVPEAALHRLHPALLALDFDAVLADRGVGRDAVTLLRDRTIERWQSWGISASFGSWFDLASTQQRNHRVVTRRRIDADGDRTRREFTGSTTYTARANGWSTTYGATFEAIDPGEGSEAETALEFWWEEARLRTDGPGIARIVDDAVLWGVADGGGGDALASQLATALEGVDRCRPRFQLALQGAAAREALALIARADLHAWARHAARALPRNSREPARMDCAAREAAYAEALASIAGLQGAALRTALAAALRGRDNRLAARERAGQVPWTCWQVLRASGLSARSAATAWQGFSDSASRLRWPALAEAFAGLRPAFEQPYTLRTVASLLAGNRSGTRLSLAYQRDGTPRTLQVTAAGADP